MDQQIIKNYVNKYKKIFPLDEDIIYTVVVEYYNSPNIDNDIVDKLVDMLQEQEKKKFNFEDFDKKFGFDIKKGDPHSSRLKRASVRGNLVTPSSLNNNKT